MNDEMKKRRDLEAKEYGAENHPVEGERRHRTVGHFKSGWDAALKAAAHMASGGFDYEAHDKKRHDDVTHLPSDDDFREGYLEGHGEGALWQHSLCHARIAELEAEKKDILAGNGFQGGLTSKYERRINELETALKFYASFSNWAGDRMITDDFDNNRGGVSAGPSEGGARARKALGGER